jgi:hypothetical protein
MYDVNPSHIHLYTPVRGACHSLTSFNYTLSLAASGQGFYSPWNEHYSVEQTSQDGVYLLTDTPSKRTMCFSEAKCDKGDCYHENHSDAANIVQIILTVVAALVGIGILVFCVFAIRSKPRKGTTGDAYVIVEERFRLKAGGYTDYEGDNPSPRPKDAGDIEIGFSGLGDDPPLETKRDGKRRRGAPRRRPPPRAGDDEDAEDEGSGSDEEDVHAWIEADAE